jgi:superfamily II DNA/RNA helicase
VLPACVCAPLSIRKKNPRRIPKFVLLFDWHIFLVFISLKDSLKEFSFQQCSFIGFSPLGDATGILYWSTRRRCISAIANMMFSVMRPYQERVVDSIGSSNNAIVKLPTGSGKTIVAAELIKRRLEVDSSLAALFLVPAQDLVEQQAVVVRTWCPAETTEVFEFMGGSLHRVHAQGIHSAPAS